MEHKQEILNKILQSLQTVLGINTNKIDMYSNLHDIGVDSLDMVEIIMELEESFNIDFGEEFSSILTQESTIPEIYDLIFEKVK